MRACKLLKDDEAIHHVLGCSGKRKQKFAFVLFV